MKNDEVSKLNRIAWDRQVASGNPWTIPVTSEIIAKARNGQFSIVLTPNKSVPRNWLASIKGKSILGLACGGGQQGPVLAAAGAKVTILDNSPAQLERDRKLSDSENLEIQTVLGDMRDLSEFPDSSFDLIVHPCSNCFVPEIQPVWNEAFRVLKSGGTMISGLVNPVIFTMDFAKGREGIAQMKYSIPYSDLDHLDDPEIKKLQQDGEPIAFGHTLEDQIGGQTRAGFHIIDFYEDRWREDDSPVHKFINTYFATRSLKP